MTDEQLKLELSVKQYLDQILEEIKKNFDSIESTLEAMTKTLGEQSKAMSKMKMRILELEGKRGHNHSKRVLQ